MDFFSIAGALRRHKVVSIPLILLTLIGVVYIVAFSPSAYQAKAEVLLTNPPAPPSASEIALNPKLQEANNPLANLGNLTYVADVLIDTVTATDAKDQLTQSGASGYQVILDNTSQPAIPPAIDIIGTGPTGASAIQSAQLVTAAILKDLKGIQVAQHVQDQFMITAVEYVTPSTATKSSSGKLQTAVGVVAIGSIALLVGLSIAQAREERNRRSRQENRPPYREDGRRQFEDSLQEPMQRERPAQHGEPWSSKHAATAYPTGSMSRPEMQQPNGGNRDWSRNG